MDDIKIWLTYHDDKLIKQYKLKETFQLRFFKANDVEMAGDNINCLNRFYSEICTLYYIWKNDMRSQYVGFCHYRRTFRQFFKVPLGHCQVLDILSDCNIMSHYKYAHNYQDLYDVIDILDMQYGKGNPYSNYLLNGNVFIPYCCFIMQYADFKELCGWLFPILFAWDKKNGLNMDSEKYVEKARRDFRYGDVDYQCRAVAFLAERLVSCYIVCNMKPFCFKTL